MSAAGQDVPAAQQLPTPAVTDPLDAWLAWLEAGRGAHIDLGLERCQEVAAALAIGKPAPVVVTVAGTNGKGSSVALLEAIWRHAGYRVGAYTSPHLLRFNERMRIDGDTLDDAAICAGFAAVETSRGGVPLTYFEFATLAALHIFSQSELDIVVLEVGLGGRLDAVNIIDADVALITAIGLDHEDWLGSTRELIGREKAGIMRRGRPVVCSDHAVPSSILDTAAATGADLRLLGADYAYDLHADYWRWWSGDDLLDELPLPALDGAHQLRNAAGVLEVIQRLQERLPVPFEAIRCGLSTVHIGGRFHRVTRQFEYVMDVAHNPQAAEIFVATLRTMTPAPRTHALVGMLKTKNHLEFLRPLVPCVDSWHFADLPDINGAPAEVLAATLRQLDNRAAVCCYASVDQAHTAIGAIAAAEDRIIVVGSCVTVGAMMRVLQEYPDS